jgi:hypothetical protein
VYAFLAAQIVPQVFEMVNCLPIALNNLLGFFQNDFIPLAVLFEKRGQLFL